MNQLFVSGSGPVCHYANGKRPVFQRPYVAALCPNGKYRHGPEQNSAKDVQTIAFYHGVTPRKLII